MRVLRDYIRLTWEDRRAGGRGRARLDVVDELAGLAAVTALKPF
jgi:hypothetical protein